MEKTFKIDRPLLFLCGPFNNPNDLSDKRNILLKEICSFSAYKNRDNNFQLMPIIVDNLFESGFIKKYNLSYKVLEEIIANISFRTYVFLDTLSTSYEIGLFDNSINENHPLSLVECGYKKRKRNKIGSYIELSVGDERFIEYEGRRTLINQYIKFRNNCSLPKQLRSLIESDEEQIYNQCKNGFKLRFVLDELNNQEIGKINYFYHSNCNSLRFEISTKTMFYYLTNSFSSTQIQNYCVRNNFYGLFKKITNDLFVHFMNSNAVSNRDKSLLIVSNPKIQIKIGDYPKSKEILKNLALIILKINTDVRTRQHCGRTINKSVPIRPTVGIFKTISKSFFTDIFNFSNEQLGVIKLYSLNPHKCVVQQKLKISNKWRSIVTYANNRNGKVLRSIHQNISDSLMLFHTFSSSSFAYQKGLSTRLCVLEHKNSSNFLKLDIHQFFNSICIETLIKDIHKLLKQRCFKTFYRYFPTKNKLKNIVLCASHNNHIPLGFVSSPVLSDIYLKDFDNELFEFNKQMVYTRYADDILLSSTECFDSKKIINFISYNLKKKKLTLNGNKKICVNLKNNGDSIHYIGINIVKRDGFNDLTISRKTLIYFAQKIHECFVFGDANDKNKVNSIAAYVKNISSISYDKLLRILQIRHNIYL